MRTAAKYSVHKAFDPTSELYVLAVKVTDIDLNRIKI